LERDHAHGVAQIDRFAEDFPLAHDEGVGAEDEAAGVTPGDVERLEARELDHKSPRIVFCDILIDSARIDGKLNSSRAQDRAATRRS
jgi:hypothetical protein